MVRRRKTRECRWIVPVVNHNDTATLRRIYHTPEPVPFHNISNHVQARPSRPKSATRRPERDKSKKTGAAQARDRPKSRRKANPRSRRRVVDDDAGGCLSGGRDASSSASADGIERYRRNMALRRSAQLAELEAANAKAAEAKQRLVRAVQNMERIETLHAQRGSSNGSSSGSGSGTRSSGRNGGEGNHIGIAKG